MSKEQINTQFKVKGDVNDFYRQNALLASVISLLEVLEKTDFDDFKTHTANFAFEGINYLVNEINNIQINWVVGGVEEVKND